MARRLNALAWSRLLEKQQFSKIQNVYARAAERSGVHRMCQGWHQREPCRAMNSWAGAAGGAAGTFWVVTVQHWRDENQQLLLIFTPGSFVPSFSHYFHGSSPLWGVPSFHLNTFLLRTINYMWEGFCSGKSSILLQSLLVLLLLTHLTSSFATLPCLKRTLRNFWPSVCSQSILQTLAWD